ncbi:MAG: thiolase family protein [Deltaproteobacteria bacterium]|nr:thiolase family protein [Deltaproteobacteria bacterium]MBW1935261.1 thiolase family protein [Deltaproteobacteria bacterium]MBW1976707.1 thiolase family protein [Deltaproteobacteria bacterium]MBW2300492.1 thiolase family protein [Deltaproteobacteria bacterium]RLB31660.1 MAG: thiolase family protein [Deltaproteobacteria bacterium]
MLTKAFIPYGGYYSSPFCRWQGTMANENSIVLGAKTARNWMLSKKFDPTMLQYLYYGTTIAQKHMFYSHAWAAAMLVDNQVPLSALMINQACTTSTTCIHLAAVNIEAGTYETAFALMSDRCSNGPHTVWPNPLGPGGEVISENWMMDNFNSDPNAGLKMIQTAENVARDIGTSKEECDAVTLRRYEQYQDALANDRAFQKRYMFPVEVRVSKKKTVVLEADEGITPTTAEGLAKLKPVEPGGVMSYGAQTHPADGNAGFIITTKEKAREISADPNVEIQIISYGFSRAKRGYMAAAPVPASEMALEKAGLKIGDIKAIKTHNPFIVNDINMAKKMGFDVMNMNNYGSSIVYGHPQGPTAGRLIAELIEELVILGGGYGLWAGCAAGDTAAAMIFKVS